MRSRNLSIESLEHRRMLKGVVVFNEVMYHANLEGGVSEWIELHNQMSVDVDISNWQLTGGAEYQFPNGTIVPERGFLLLASHPELFEDLSSTVPVLGPFTGRLSNSGDDLTLQNNSNRVMDRLSYSDRGKWPSAADGSGATLAKLLGDSPSDDSASWTFSLQHGGTPGRENFVPPGRKELVVIVPERTAARVLVPTDNRLGDNWHSIDFDDSGWTSGDTGIGFDLRDDYDFLFGLDLDAPPDGQAAIPMNGVNQSAYIRIPFELADDPTHFEELVFNMRFEDGFVAYLNGTEIARENAPDDLEWNSSALQARPDNIATSQQPFNVTGYRNLLRQGTNLLAIHGLNSEFQRRTGDFLILPELLATRSVPADIPLPLKFHEVAGATDDSFFVELKNHGNSSIQLNSYAITIGSREIHPFQLPATSLQPGSLVHFTEAEIGFKPLLGENLFLVNSTSNEISDGVRFVNALKGQSDEHSSWLTLTAPTPGQPNLVDLHDEIVINEIMYQGAVSPSNLDGTTFVASDEEWLELYNRSDQHVLLNQWHFAEGIDYEFPPEARIAPGEYVVIAKHPNDLLAMHPGLDPQSVFGPYGGQLANGGESITLVDGQGNPVDEVTYYDRGRWHPYANGGRSSLELKDVHADNSISESWSASQEAHRSEWATFTYRGQASSIGNDPELYHELLFGLLDAGEFLIDDITVSEHPDSPQARQLIQNSNFESDSIGDSPDKWRIIGNHQSRVVMDPQNESNHVLHVVASGPTEHMHNNAGTTLKHGEDLVTIDESAIYEISFRAKWLGGSNKLHTRLYFNRLAQKNLLPIQMVTGTPGRLNSIAVENAGPTFAGLRHVPSVPQSDQAVRVSIEASDPDGIREVNVLYARNGTNFTRIPMAQQGDRFEAEIPPQRNESVVQFFVEAVDSQGKASTFPPQGSDSRALYKVEDGAVLRPGALSVRLVMTNRDAATLHRRTNVMSNDRLRGTVIISEQEVFHDVQIRLKGAQRIRSNADRVGFNIRLDPQQKFRGVHDTILLDRNGGRGTFEQKEILVKHSIQHAGDVPSTYDDLAIIVSPQNGKNLLNATTGMLITGAYTGDFLDSMFVDGSEGNAYEYELIYYPTTTESPRDPESLKLPSPDETARVDLRTVRGHEENPEAYRWHFQHDNRRDYDEYSRLISILETLGETNSDIYQTEIQTKIDVDQWLRTFAIISLFGVNDNYGTGSQHNAIFYIRPEDGRMMFFPWDMDFAFDRPATSDLIANNDLRKLLTDPNNAHAFYGHVHDILSTTFNNAYLDRWIDHYGEKVSDPFPQTYKQYITNRAAKVTADCGNRECLPERVEFRVTSETNLDVGEATVATVTGTGWIDVREIRAASSSFPLDVEWIDSTTWRADVPVNGSTQEFTLNAINFSGERIGSEVISLRSTASNSLLDSLRISEIHYNPLLPTAFERQLGLSNDDFEFIELVNQSETETLDLNGVRFTDGIDFTFSTASKTMLSPGEVILVVADKNAFEIRYGAAHSPLIVGSFANGTQLRNNGEAIRLEDAFGNIIQAFSYDDRIDAGWPAAADGHGKSLEVINRLADYSDPRNWRASVPIHGTPGAIILVSGDLNSDGELTAADIDAMCLGITNADESFDFSHDGRLDHSDILVFVQQILQKEIGDVNLDGAFNSQDLVLVFQSGEFEDGVAMNSSWTDGDWNCDDEFNARDLVFAFQHSEFQFD